MRKLLTVTFTIAEEDGHVHIHEDTQTHGNAWGEVYRGFKAIQGEVNRQVAEQRQCPFHPRTEKPWPS